VTVPKAARASLWLLCLALTLLTAQITTHAGGAFFTDVVFGTYVYSGVVFLCAIPCLLRALAVPDERPAWAGLGLAIAIWGAGDTYYSFAFDDAAVVPAPSVADVCYLAFYVPAYLGVAHLARHRVARAELSRWLDGGIAGLVLGAVAMTLVFRPIQAATGGGTATVVTNLAYPVADAVLVAVAVGAATFRGWPLERSFVLITAGLSVFGASDCAYLYRVAGGTYEYGTVLDLGWVFGMALIAFAAWQRPGARPAVPKPGWGTIVTPSAFATVAIVMQVYDHFVRVELTAIMLATAATALAVARLLLTFGEHLRLLRRTEIESVTDALTGLGNRRRLHVDLNEAFASGRPHVLALFDLNGFKRYNDSFGHPAGDALLSRIALKLRDISGASAYRFGGDEFCLLVDGSAERALDAVSAASAALCEIGDGFAVTAAHGVIELPDEAGTPELCLRLADQRMYASKLARRPIASDVLPALVTTLEAADRALGDHASQVAELAVAVAGLLGLGADETADVVATAGLHDIGKIGIPDEILFKPEPLSDGEWAFVRRHTLIGERIVASAGGLRHVGPLIRASHERWDGRGYPDGLRGAAIPLVSRIVFACDAYNAMTSDRPYRPALSPEAALSELERNRGTQFDPRVVRAVHAVVRGRLPRAA